MEAQLEEKNQELQRVSQGSGSLQGLTCWKRPQKLTK